ncbi:hypothetical protein [Streptomyces olivaceoviridis]|uniref:hypothetical protein n=1 Tax=Streptomyces olivaceoviridis TaxID=1921 RepID=UPI0036F4F810
MHGAAAAIRGQAPCPLGEREAGRRVCRGEVEDRAQEDRLVQDADLVQVDGSVPGKPEQQF